MGLKPKASAAAKLFEDADPQNERGWGERIDRFPLDTLLRKFGWKVAHRPAKKPSVWTKDGETLTFKEALEQLPYEIRKANNLLPEKVLRGGVGR